MSRLDSEIDVLGYRAKIGILVPFTNTIVQPEFESMAPQGVTNHTARIPNRPRPTHSDEAYAEVMKEGAVGTEEVIDRLLPLDPNLIILGHSIDSFRGGIAGAKSLERRLNDHAKICDVVLPSLALNSSLEKLEINKSLSILSPYLKPGGDQAVSFLEDCGFKIIKIKNLACPTPLSIAAVSESESKSYIQELNAENVEAIVQVGTNLPFQRVAAEAESSLGKPVLSINTATYWYALRKLKIFDKLNGFGALFENN